MRSWLVLLLLPLAGCIAPEPFEPEHRVYLLGLDPCHAGTCWEGTPLGPLTHTLTIRNMSAFAPGPGHDQWIADGILWGLDRATRQLVKISDGAIDVVAGNHSVTFVPATGDTVWQYDWTTGKTVRLAPPLGGSIRLLAAYGQSALVAVDGNESSVVLLDGGPQTVATGPRATSGALSESTAAYVESVGFHDQIWAVQQASISPLWTTAERVSNLAITDKTIAAETTGLAGPNVHVWRSTGGSEMASYPGFLIGIDDGQVWRLASNALGPTAVERTDITSQASQEVFTLQITPTAWHLTQGRGVLIAGNSILEFNTDIAWAATGCAAQHGHGC